MRVSSDAVLKSKFLAWRMHQLQKKSRALGFMLVLLSLIIACHTLRIPPSFTDKGAFMTDKGADAPLFFKRTFHGKRGTYKHKVELKFTVSLPFKSTR